MSRHPPPGLGSVEGRVERGAARMLGDMDEEDEAFQLPAGGTRLATLFGQDQKATESEKVLFQYMPPKQPKKGQPATAAGFSAPKHPPAAAAAAAPATVPAASPAPTAAVQSVFFATAVHAYLLTNGKYEKHGKYGVAIVGNNEKKEFRMIIYINKLQQIATARIHAWFVTTVQPNNYCTFYDDQRQNWSIMFDSETVAVEFGKQLCIAKYNSSPTPNSVLHQDLVLGDGPGVETGDALDITFTGWLFQNGSLGEIFDSNVNKRLLRLRLGSGKIIKGWEDGMIGMKKGGRRFLLIPPALAYGPSGEAERIPPDSTLAFEVEVKRVRFAKDAGSAGQSLSPGDSLTTSPASQSERPATDPASLTRPTPAPKPGEPAVRAKSSSISERLANPDITKVKLISRMAKMGQPMLPVPSSTFTPQQDSVDKEPYAGTPYAYPQVSAAVSQLQPVGLCPAPFQAAGDINSFLLTESRQQSTQICLAIRKMADKMDLISFKLEEMRKQHFGSSLLPGVSSANMATSMVTSNSQRILQENERLKQQMIEKSKHIEEQNMKIRELTDRSLRYVEQINTLLQRILDNTQARVLHAEQKVGVSEELEEPTVQIYQLQLELTRDLHVQLNEALAKSDKQILQINQLHAMLAEHEDMERKYQEDRMRMDEMVAALKEELADLSIRKENLEKLSLLRTTRSSERETLSPWQEQPEPVEGKVKKIMNEVFQSLRGQFNLEESYTGQEVLGIVLNTIKAKTLQLLEDQEQQRRRSNTREKRSAERYQTRGSPERLLYGDPQSDSLQEPIPLASSTPLATAPSTVLEGAQYGLFSATPKAPGEQTPAGSAHITKPPLGLSTTIDKEASSTQGEIDTTDTTILAPAMEGPTMGPKGEEESGASQYITGLTSQATLADKQLELVGDSPSEPASSPTQLDSSLLEDGGSFFNIATPKPFALRTLLAEDEEEEEEVSLKGRPPPTSLFEDYEDEDDDDPYLLG